MLATQQQHKIQRLTLSFNNRIMKALPIHGELLIGRSNDCDIHIDNLGVSMIHARVTLNGDGDAVITDTSEENGLTLNGQPISTHVLKPGDKIMIGKHMLSYSEQFETVEDEPEAIPGKAMPVTNGWLQFMNGPKLGRTLRLDRALIKLGKTGKQSAMISGRSDGYYISHLEGDDPTRVGNTPIQQDSVKLNNGDTIQIGNIKMMFFTENP